MRRFRFPTLLSVFLTLLNDRLSESIFLPLLPFLLTDFSRDGSTVGFLSGSYALSQFTVAPLIGALSDRFGRKPVISVCVLGSVLGMGLFATTLSLPWQQWWPGAAAAGLPLGMLFLARIIDGASGGTAATATAVLADITTPENRARAFGLIGVASSMVREQRVGVLATPATVASCAYTASIQALHPNTEVVEQACPAFVPLIEAGGLGSADLREAARTYLEPLLDRSVQSIVLGCTHYPMLVPLLRQLIPSDVVLIDPAIGVAQQLDAVLGPPLATPPTALPLQRCRLCVTADPAGFADRACSWLGVRPQAQLVHLQCRSEGH